MNKDYKELLTKACNLLAVATDSFPSDDEIVIAIDELMEEIKEVESNDDDKDKMSKDETVSSKDNTYKDLLVQSMERINNEKGNYSLCLSEFCISLSALIVYLTAEHEKRLSEKEPTIIEVFDILRGSDFVKSAITGLQMYRFVSWLLEETIEESNDEGEIDWYDFHQIAGKWNEFAATEASESEDGE